MPLIQCPSCLKTYQVKLTVLGKTVECRNCQEPFEAMVKRSGPKLQQKRFPIRGVLFGSFGVAIALALIFTLQKGTDAPANAGIEKPTPSGSSTESPLLENPSTSNEKPEPISAQSMEGVLRQFFAALEAEDPAGLSDSINFAAMWSVSADREGATWSELDQLDQFEHKKSWVESLFDSRASFVDNGVFDNLNVIDDADNASEVIVTLRDPVSLDYQECTVFLVRSGGKWGVASFESSNPTKFQDPSNIQVRETEYADLSDVERLAGPGVVEAQEYPEGTDPEIIRRAEAAVSILEDLDRTREASTATEQLAAFGKPSIVSLLNSLAKQDIRETEDRMRAQRLTNGLRAITGEIFGYSPASMDGKMNDRLQENNHRAIRGWFAWWQSHKNSWTPPEAEAPKAKRKRMRNLDFTDSEGGL